MNALLAAAKYLSNLSALPAIIIGIERRSLLWYYACLSFSCDAISFSLKRFAGCKHYHVTNTFLALEFVMVSEFLVSACCGHATRRRGRVLIYTAALGFVAHTITISPYRCNFNAAALLYCGLIGLCILALYRVIAGIDHLRIEQSPLFTFAAAFLVYASGTWLLILFEDYLVSNFSRQTVGRIWALHDPLNLLKNLAVARVLFLEKNRPALAVRY